MNAIEVKNLSYTYPDGTKALKDISFAIKENESLGLIGPNGAGKSTLLLCICGLLEATGEIKIFGETLTKKNAKELRKFLSLVFQNPEEQLFMPTVYEDVAFGLEELISPPNEIHKIVENSLESAGLSGFETRMNHHLSLGEKKKVCLATALARRSRLMLFDEPTGQMDPGGRREFIYLIKEIELAKVISCHDLNLVVETCPTTVLLNRGQVIIKGETIAILSNENLMRMHKLEVPSLLLSKQENQTRAILNRGITDLGFMDFPHTRS